MQSLHLRTRSRNDLSRKTANIIYGKLERFLYSVSSRNYDYLAKINISFELFLLAC